MDPNTIIGDLNTERLLQSAYKPEPVPADFAANLEKKLLDTAQKPPQPAPATVPVSTPTLRWSIFIAGSLAACILGLLAFSQFNHRPRTNDKTEPESVKTDEPTSAPTQFAKWTDDVRDGMMPRQRPTKAPPQTLTLGESLATKAGERRLVQLSDGTRLYVNEKSIVEVKGPRQLSLNKGQIYLEVAPREKEPAFTVKCANREMTATGTHFAVQTDPEAAGVAVTQGKVAVKGIDQEVTAGQRIAPGAAVISTSPRASHLLEWTRELMAAAETPMVPGCQHAGGALLALDPNGQEIKLALREYHVDVHIEDGFARTTIDQTYFNTTWERLEGTFYFPLPPDASLSRLAMYVADANNQCKLMEGGMAERQHAANVYETIRYQRRDPALLEWLDGSTFKMRVFPLEAKQEKRIILGYTQKLPALYGIQKYRFPGGHSLPVVRDWSFNARVKNGIGMNVSCPSHETLTWLGNSGDMVASLNAKNIKPQDDVVLELQQRHVPVDQDLPRFASFQHEKHTYLMMRYRPQLPSLPQRQRRDWIILFEASAHRDPLLAGTQVDILREVLRNAEYDDTFVLLTANTKTQVYNDKALPARPKNVEEALKFLNSTHLIGALDLQQALITAGKFAKEAKNPYILHVGSGTPAMGERDAGKLAKLVPDSTRYVGIGVGKRWNRSFMKTVAERTNGLYTQINPDEVIAWRAFDLLATLNTPRLLGVQVIDGNLQASFLTETTMIAQGEEICAFTRIDPTKTPLPGRIFVKGTLDGKPMIREFPVMNALEGAGYLPRMWAKQEIDRLLVDGASKNKDAIIALSKAMYVMSPFTSLLVLETEADYERYKVDRGRKDHWAMYACPPKIPLVYEPSGPVPVKQEVKKPDQSNGKPLVETVLQTIVDPNPQPIELFHEGIDKVPDTVLRDVLVKVEETRTGSLMIGAGMSRPSLSPYLNLLRESDPAANYYRIIQQSTLPARDIALPPGNDGTGNTTKTKFKKLEAEWEQLPPRERKRALQELSTDFSPRHREAVENYFRNKTEWKVGLSLNSPLGFRSEATPRLSQLFDQLDDARNLYTTGKLNDAEQIVKLIRQRDPDNTAAFALDFMINTKRNQQKYDPDVNANDKIFMKALRGNLGTYDDMSLPMPEKKKIKESGYDQASAAQDIAKDLNPSWGMGRFGLGEQAYVGEVIIVGDSVTKDRVIRRIVPTAGQLLEYPPVAFKEEKKRRSYLSTALRYDRPPYEYDSTLFTNLLQYAPGLHHTEVDVLATLEQEADVAQPKLGTVDAVALKLINQARSSNWFTLTVPADGPLPSYKVSFNGLGQFSFERILVSGLREQVVCDGKALWHLYPEIGLAAKRPFSRYHQGLLKALSPSFLPSAEELARGHDVKTVNATTIALVPLGIEALEEAKYYRLQLVFAAEGQLSERQIVEMPSGSVVSRQIFLADGSVEWRDGKDKIVAKQTRDVAPAQAPNLQPNVRDLVVLTLPIRTRDHILEQAKKRGLDADTDPAIVEQWFVSDCLSKNLDHDRFTNSFEKVLHARGDRRLGFYVLINAANFHIELHPPRKNNKPEQIDIAKDHPNNALAMFLASNQKELATNSMLPFTDDLPGPKDGFIQRLNQYRNLWLDWHRQTPLQNNNARLPIDKARVLNFLQETTSPSFASGILDVMQRRCNIVPSDYMMSVAVKRFGPISDPLGVGYVFRYEHARSLWQDGKGQEAAKLFTELHAETLQAGILPPIDAAFRDVLQMPVGDGPKFIRFTRKTLEDLLAQKRYGLAFQLVRQTDQLGDEALSSELLATILARAPAKERNALMFVCARFHAERKNFLHADRLVQELLQNKELAEVPDLWRWRTTLAQDHGKTGIAMACLEKALELEYADLPELVNLEKIRNDYRSLLQHYQKTAEALTGLEKETPKAFLAKVIRTADRWRLLDTDSPEPCQLAGKIFHTLGKSELAWNYWTTPIDLHPAESKAWLELAETMKIEGDLSQADRAFTLAFETEPTNPEILWQRAQNLVRMGKTDDARQLYRQIVAGQWQERFNATVEQARGLATQ